MDSVWIVYGSATSGKRYFCNFRLHKPIKMPTAKTYNAINASAGSGKTYSLVMRVLMICLAKPNRHDAIKHILALTFTNKAANEMKERILSWLKAFTKPDYATNTDLKNIRVALADNGIHVDLDELHHRSQKVLDYILHHYSTLNIGTIDKFNSRLVRSFSYELGLAHQFNLEIQSEPYLIEAVDKMLDEVGDGNQISSAFMDFVEYNLENEERISINQTLYKRAKQFVNDIHYEELKNNENFDWQAYEATKKLLREEIDQLRRQNLSLAQEAMRLMKERNLENADFYGGSNKCIKYFFDSFLQNGEPKLQPDAEAEVKKTDYFRNGASKAGQPKAHLIDEILEKLIENRSEIINNYVKAEKKSKILRELLPLKINKEIQEQLTQIEDENDIVLLSKFNVLINENLKNEPSAFIYEKIGTRYQHFFLDEFQDTSKMQWENIIPLRDHTITSAENSFTLVGDPKQSIYRFRGGDSDLMLNILNKKEQTPVEVSVEVLGNNWRSAKNIVDFNNELYTYISNGLEPQHKKLFSDDGRQIARKENPGRVKVYLNDYDRSTEPFFDTVSEQMHCAIQECVEGDFRFSDITILCRTAKEIQKFSQKLGGMMVNYDGKPAYIKTISEKGLTLGLSHTLMALTEFLRWEIQPKNSQYPVKMLYHLQQLGKIKTEDFSAEMMEMLQQGNKEKTENYLHKKYGLKLRRTDFPNLNLYNYIEYYLHEFSHDNKETDFLLNFLEMLYAFTQNSGLTVKDFIKYWDEEASGISIQASNNVDAINLMTIHAAKGLEFPVVFLPMQNSHKDSDFSDWLPLEGYNGLKSVNIKGFSKDLAGYDEGIAHFNEQNTYRNKIDRLCIQYVATTRPVEQLHLFIQRPSKSQNYLEIFEFIQTKNPENLDEFDVYPQEHQSFQKKARISDKKPKTLAISQLSTGHENINNIQIATPSRNYQNTVESVRTGIFSHEILSKIKTKNDVERVLESYLIAGEITRNEQKVISEKITNLLERPDLKPYFEEGTTAINEKDIMISDENGTATYRPDRLVETADGFFIIDFKTGTEKPQHEEQIKKYAQILERLGKKVLKTKIVYI